MATIAGHTQPTTAGHGRARPRWVMAWAWTLTVLSGALFASVTALTLTLWATNRGYSETGPVVDLAFFALGGILVTVGIASQCGGARAAGLQQTVLALLALAGAALAAGRVEPFVGALVLLVALTPLAVSHPARRSLFAVTPGQAPSRPLAMLAAAAAVPAVVYAAGMLERVRGAGPSCFLGQCAQGDRYSETAALAIAVVLVAGLAALRTDGWQLPARCAGAAAIVLGAASIAFPGDVGALATWWAITAIGWGAAVIALGQQPDRSTPRRHEATSQQGR